MNISSTHQIQSTVVSIQGNIDAMTANEVSSFVSTRIGENETKLVVDLAQVEFMSSAGLRAILVTMKKCRQQGGDLRLAAPQPGVEKILKTSGFTDILKTFSTVDEAVKSYNA